ncbi:hypothetical protein ACJIZ3_019454 [Penstemon smallii]|uniref:Uncharacterized protein n=1 Tax=Penstemon smallii TaxID=265156 RepID=A0ABD3T1C2_9LAMI
MGDDKLSCGIDNEFSGLSWPSHFTSVNDSFMKEAENLTFEAGASCTLDEFSHFELFLQKVIPVAREFFLPPERHRFALVRERSLLSLLNVEEPGSWSMAVSFAACPSCLKVLREGDDLRTVLQTQVSPVLELEDDLHGGEVTLPAKRPTALLFVDRSSDSLQIKRESQRALNVFRELAQLYAMENQIRGLSSRPEKTSTETNLASRSTLRPLRLQSFPASKKFILKDKMSITIMNEGQQITVENLVPDLQGSSVHEILSYALKRKKELKLSSLAKDAGFQLLSKDFDVEIVDSLPPHSEVRSTQFIGERLVEGDFKSSVDLNENEMAPVSSGGQSEELPDPSDAEHILLEGKEDSLDKSSKSNLESEHGMGVATDNTQGWNEAIRLSGIDENEQNKYFRGSFFFFDGQYRLLETLTGGLKMPSVVIIDPISQQHYVSDEQSVFNCSLLSVFVNSFLTGKLFPHQQSAPAVHSPIGALKPPFVNLDFHEKNSIPLVTVHSFAELIIGNKSDSKNSRDPWDRNVLVLFSNSWCGFCQRMELVVREVYRAIKGCAKMKRNSSWKENLTSTSEYVEDIALKLPLIYMMDCTQNDCSLIIKPTLQRELYPLLLLFPAERKDSILVYEGDIAVSDIIKFLADHGSHVLDLIMDKSFIQDQNSGNEDPKRRNLHHEVLLKDRLQSETVKYDQMTSQFPVSTLELFAGCFLIATEKLLDVHPFDESKILILRVDQGTGFQGLIINKHISWDSLEEIEEGFELLKDAPLSFGGPVMRRGMPLVALTHKYIEGQSQEVLPNIYFVDHLATRSLLEEIRAGNQSVHDYWFFLGYSSWGWDQLFLEIAQGAWNVSQDNSEQLNWPVAGS